MSTFIDLDSIWRDREDFPNENDYELKPMQVESWFKTPRTVKAYPENPNTYSLGFATTVNIKHLAIAYTETLSELPKVYVNFRSMNYKDIHLINSIDGVQRDAKFVCVPERIQNDRNGNPIWIHYRCNMEQTMRFQRKDQVIFQILTRNGQVLPSVDTIAPNPPDPLKQTLCTLEITPYIIDGDYDNHMSQTLGS